MQYDQFHMGRWLFFVFVLFFSTTFSKAAVISFFSTVAEVGASASLLVCFLMFHHLQLSVWYCSNWIYISVRNWILNVQRVWTISEIVVSLAKMSFFKNWETGRKGGGGWWSCRFWIMKLRPRFLSCVYQVLNCTLQLTLSGNYQLPMCCNLLMFCILNQINCNFSGQGIGFEIHPQIS